MGYKEMYEEWLNNPYFDDATKAELKAIEGNEKEIEDRFYMDLEFGDCLNYYTRKAPTVPARLLRCTLKNASRCRRYVTFGDKQGKAGV